MKTNFSFDVQYPAYSQSSQSQRNEVMGSLGPVLQKLLAAQDSEATVAVSDSHKGGGNKIVELTTTLRDEQIAKILKVFSEQHEVSVSAIE